jgi:hypothetical protein
MELDLTIEDDAKFLADITDAFDSLIDNYPEHVFRIRDSNHADQLFDQGRLADEQVIPPPSTGSTIKTGPGDPLRPMKLNLKPKPKSKIKPRVHPSVELPGGGILIPGPPVTPAISKLIWVSTPLKRRDLNIPTAAGTNPTGSMGWTKGTFETVDQRHYFREEVFEALQWNPDPRPNRRHLERASANFELIIKGVNYGNFNLRLSHSTDRTSVGYQQNNFMTQIHWGDAREHVAKSDLLGRTYFFIGRILTRRSL